MGHLWTIAAEMRFYVLLPPILVLVIVVLRRSLVAATIFAAVLVPIWQDHLYPPHTISENTPYALPYLAVFLGGVIVAVYQRRLSQIGDVPWVRRGLDVLGLAILAGIVTTIPGIRRAMFDVPISAELVFWYAKYGAAWSLFLLCMLNGRGLTRRTLETKLMRFFGQISYPAYLVHWLIIIEVGQRVSAPLFAIPLAVAGTIASSYLLHIAVEKPLSRVDVRKRFRTRAITQGRQADAALSA